MTREETTTTGREPADAEIEVRHCHGLAEFERCLELQRRVWGGADIDTVPLPLFVVAAETGGQVLGAFAGQDLIGFTMALAGMRDAHGRVGQPQVEEEVGDLLFVAVNVARFLGMDPEVALKKANRKFAARFREMERQAARSGRRLADLSRDDLEALWNASKAKREPAPASGEQARASSGRAPASSDRR